MKKILVTSIEFKTSESGARSIEFELNNNERCVLIPNSEGVSSIMASKMTRTIKNIAYLVIRACASFLIGDKEETMSMGEMSHANTLATERFDWAAAGYAVGSGDEEEMQERCMEMCISIAHFEDI